MSEGFKGGKVPPSTIFKSIEELVVADSEVLMKKVEDAIVYQVHLKYDTQATIQSIIERLRYADKLEKALDKACEQLYWGLDDNDDRNFYNKEQWKEWCLEND